MSSPALRLLQLQREFNELAEGSALSEEFKQEGWAPRSEDEIAAEYEETLRTLLS